MRQEEIIGDDYCHLQPLSLLLCIGEAAKTLQSGIYQTYGSAGQRKYCRKFGAYTATNII